MIVDELGEDLHSEEQDQCEYGERAEDQGEGLHGFLSLLLLLLLLLLRSNDSSFSVTCVWIYVCI